MISKLILAFVVAFLTAVRPAVAAADRVTWWPFQAIDTMKYSRDLAREKLTDSKFDAVIDRQVKDIADVGATHVGIATPYDQEFLPFLKKWVAAARKYHLNVWFRGNFSGWEGWFGYPKISRQDHLRKTRDFISAHPELFADGDVFSPCPECENGGPGDPRQTGDTAGHRQFLIESYKQSLEVFRLQGKSVLTNYHSMNGDVARLIMDRQTTQALGGIVVIDHYVSSPQELVADIRQIAQSSGGKVVLGEFGAPIPSIHGKMTDSQQAEWIGEALKLLSGLPQLTGISYWVNVGGGTQLWTESGRPQPAVTSLRFYFSPPVLTLVVKNTLHRPLSPAKASFLNHEFSADSKGQISIPLIASSSLINVSSPGFFHQTLKAAASDASLTLTLTPVHETLLYKALILLYRLRSIILH